MTAHSNAREIACALLDEQLRERRAMARESLLPHLIAFKKLESGLRLTFAETDTRRSSVETFVSLERQCCGFLAFTISPPDEGLRVSIEGPPEAQATLEMFAATFAIAP